MLKKILDNPGIIIAHIMMSPIGKIFSDRTYLKILYRAYTRKKLHLNNPVCYTEKLQWLKLHNTSDLCTTMVDKYGVREFVKKTIGEEYLIPLLGVWSHFDEIDFNSLPEKFVLKCTHDSGSVVICRDKAVLDKKKAKEKLEKGLKRNYYWRGREYPYKNVPPRIIAEQYTVDDNDELNDYKFFCFDGEPQMLFYASERFAKEKGGVKFDYYDMNLKHLDIQSYGNLNAKPENYLKPFPEFEKMKELAKVLSTGFAHVRVDLYLVKGRIYFGEMTFHHDGGFVPFIPEKWDKILGDYINLKF